MPLFQFNIMLTFWIFFFLKISVAVIYIFVTFFGLFLNAVFEARLPVSGRYTSETEVSYVPI